MLGPEQSFRDDDAMASSLRYHMIQAAGPWLAEIARDLASHA
jgi:hypothetical protein